MWKIGHPILVLERLVGCLVRPYDVVLPNRPFDGERVIGYVSRKRVIVAVDVAVVAHVHRDCELVTSSCFSVRDGKIVSLPVIFNQPPPH